MKKVLFLLMLLSQHIFANVYYVTAGGNNTTGLSPANGWQNIAKVNAMFAGLAAGDQVLFNRGETFYGALVISKSGTNGNQITLGDYGSGAKPLISGFTTASGFTNIGGNIWESSAITLTNKTNMVTIGGVATALGRFPNTGYNFYSASDGTTFITDAALSGLNFNGGRLCIRKLTDIISNDTITNQSGTTLTYTGGSGYNTLAGYGYFVENNFNTLDIQNEWFFNFATRKIDIYSASSPVNVNVSTIDTLIYVGTFGYITINNLQFTGANISAISFGAVTGQNTNTNITNCDFNYTGRNAVYGTFSTGAIINNCTFKNSLNTAIYCENEGGRSLNVTVTNCNIDSTGMLPGMGYINAATSDNISYNAISILGDGSLVQYNIINHTGHAGIAGFYSGQKFKNNLITNFAMLTGDVGAINFFALSAGIETGIEVANNIIDLPGLTNYIGTPNTNSMNGIYFDDKIDGAFVHDNFVGAGCIESLYYHNTTNMTAWNNTFYGADDASYSFRHDNHAVGIRISNIIFTNNICFQLTPTFGAGNAAKAHTFIFAWNDIDGYNLDSTHLRLDSNTYCRPSHPTDTTFSQRRNITYTYLTLTSWKALYSSPSIGTPWDAHSTEMTLNTNNSNYQYNATNATSTYYFNGFQKKDVFGNIYNNSVTIPSWGSIILIDNGAAPSLNIWYMKLQ